MAMAVIQEFAMLGRTGIFFSKPSKWQIPAELRYNEIKGLEKQKQFSFMYHSEHDIYQLVKACHRRAEDIGRFHSVSDENGKLISDHAKATKCSRDYFKKISMEEFLHPLIPYVPPVLGCVQAITSDEVAMAIQMKLGKATEPDEAVTKLWKSQHWNPYVRIGIV